MSDATRQLAVERGVDPSAFAEYGDRQVKGKGLMRTHLFKTEAGDWPRALQQKREEEAVTAAAAAAAAAAAVGATAIAAVAGSHEVPNRDGHWD